MVLTLLQTMYRGEPIEGVSDEFYKDCLLEIERDALWGQAHFLLRNLTAKEPLPSFFVRAVKDRHLNVVAQNLFVRHHEDAILNSFERQQIEVIPLKGTRFAERFFGNLAARGTSDVDILVKPDDLPQVVACLQSLGYSAPEEYNPRHYHFIVRKMVGCQEAVVEVHWNIVKGYTSNLDVAELWDSSKVLEPYVHVRELSVPFTFYSICLHGANHKMESAKHYIDVAQILFKYGHEISYPWLFGRARRDKTLRRIQMVLSRVYATFPDLWRVKPLLVPGNKSLGDESSTKVFTRMKFTSLTQYDSLIHRLRVMKDWAWPKPEIARWFLKAQTDVPSYRLYLMMYGKRLRKAVHWAKMRTVKELRG